MEALQEGGQALEPFRKALADQITYLGSDLNPTAVNSLKPQAAKLNAQGGEVFAKVDQATAKANSLFPGPQRAKLTSRARPHATAQQAKTLATKHDERQSRLVSALAPRSRTTFIRP